MRRIQYTNSRNQVFVASYDENAEYILRAIEGSKAADVQAPYMSGYRQHGGTASKSFYGIRPLMLSFYVAGSSAADIDKRLDGVERIFNPLLEDGTLIIENDNHIRMIKAKVTEPIEPVENLGYTKVCRVGFTAGDPFFRDVSETRIALRDFIGGLRFPHRMPMRFGKRGDQAQIINRGDAPAPIRCEFLGEALNPMLTNETTGESIRISATISGGDMLVINTGYGKKTVEIIREDGTTEDAYNDVDEDATDFFSLVQGTNVIKFRADAGAPQVYVNYFNLYGSA